MRHASAAFNHAAMNGQTVGKVDCYLADGTFVSFGPQDIMQGGISVTSATSNSGSFGIGCAVIGRCTIRLRNDHRQLNGLALSKARVIPYVGALVDDEIEWLKLGVYWVEPFEVYDDIVSLSCLDALSKLELPCPIITGEKTLGEIVETLCQTCSVTLATQSFHDHGYTVQSMPDLSSRSCLEVLSYVAQIAGCYAVADHDGNVRLSWYAPSFGESELDGEGFHFEVDDADGGGSHFGVDDANGGGFIPPYAITELKSLSASVAPHTVTGLAVSDVDNTQSVEGSDGYVLHIKDNPLVESGRSSDVAKLVAPRVLGRSLRSVRVSMPGSPVMEAGDPITVYDRFDEEYSFWATSITWGIGGTLSASCDVESSSPLVRTQRRSSGGSSVDPTKVTYIINNIVPSIIADTVPTLPEITGIPQVIADTVPTLPEITGIPQVIADTVPTLPEITGIPQVIADTVPTLPEITGIQTDIGTIQTDIGSDYDYDTDGSINDRLNTLETSVGNYDSTSGDIESRLETLENGTSVGQWIIQVNGVAQSTGTLNFIT